MSGDNEIVTISSRTLLLDNSLIFRKNVGDEIPELYITISWKDFAGKSWK